MLSAEGFQEELVSLGLYGSGFGPTEYADALGLFLGVNVVICVFPDVMYPELARALARSGRVAELHYSKDRGTCVILVPSSLPPMMRTLAVYHELGHLAAGDPFQVWESGAKAGRQVFPERRLARKPPLAEEALREREADRRAEYALLAGCLGLADPNARSLYDAL